MEYSMFLFDLLVDLRDRFLEYKERLMYIPLYLIACKKQTITELELREILEYCNIPLTDTTRHYISLLQGSEILYVTELCADSIIDITSRSYLDALFDPELRAKKLKIENDAKTFF